jgi:hypothetical protein
MIAGARNDIFVDAVIAFLARYVPAKLFTPRLGLQP